MKVMNRDLSSMRVSNGTLRARFMTTRVRSLTWTMLMLRRSPSLAWWDGRPRPFAVDGKSKATRAGLAMLKLAGTAASGWRIVTLTMVLPPWGITCRSSMLLAGAAAPALPDCAQAAPQAQISAATAISRCMCFIS